MRAPKRKQLIPAALAAGCLLLSLVCFIPTGPGPEALKVTVLGPTNGPSGSPMSLVSVTNNTGQARYFYFAAEVPTPTGWADVRGYVERQHGLTQRLAARAACQVLVPAPEGAAKWRFCCSSSPDVSKVEWIWYRLVRWIGLSRVGFREYPRASYVWTAQVAQ
jgi:hypothetical protein